MRPMSRPGALTVMMTLCSLSCPGADIGSDPHACRDIADPTARLACFDRAVGAAPSAGSRSATGTTGEPVAPVAPAPAAHSSPAAASPAEATPVVDPAAPPMDAQQQFGLPEHTVTEREIEAGRRPAELKRLDAHIVGIAVAADQRLVFTLDDGQVWRQNGSEGELLAKQGDAVTIKRGLLGSFWMQLPSGRGCKVSRLH